MLITIRQPLGPQTKLLPGGLNMIIGRTVSINWPGGPSKAKIADAQVIDGGHTAEISLDVDARLEEFVTEHLGLP